MVRILPRLALCSVLLCTALFPQDIASFEKRITVKTLPNGLTVIVMQRPEAPVFSFYTIVDAGSAQDPMGKTGLAHMFEHMAFKGSTHIGTKNYAAERLALDKVEAAYAGGAHHYPWYQSRPGGSRVESRDRAAYQMD